MIINRCAACGANEILGQDSMEGVVPDEGAVMTCGACACLSVFDGAQWRLPTAQERDALLQDEDVITSLSQAQETALWLKSDQELSLIHI